MIGLSDEVGSSKRFGVVAMHSRGWVLGNRRETSMDALLPTHLMIEIML